MSNETGQHMHELMGQLWPICRSITGDGVRQTLAILQQSLPQLEINEIPTGTRCFDWTVPNEWTIRDAYVLDPDGNKAIDFQQSNLHLVNYSMPVDLELELDELQPYLHSLPEQPDAIPYITSYYRESWGFCLTQRARERLRPGKYRIVIDSELKPGSLSYAELLLPGESEREVFISTYVCHPSMANNELSGPIVTSFLAQWLQTLDRRYSYRIVFIPETIGAICYLSKHLQHLQQRVIAGYVVTCVGDERAWSFMPSRNGNSLSDQVARHVLKHLAPDYTEYSFLERGSDERQYCSPGVDLPMASVMRSKYVTYPEYHTSLDDMKLVTPLGLQQALQAYQRMIETIESDCIPAATVLCEPKMSDRGLRPTLGKRGSADAGKAMMNLLAYADGKQQLLDIAEIINEPAWELRPLVDQMVELDLLRTDQPC